MPALRPLAWGRRYLACAPEHFRVDYAINPWMDLDTPVDPELALAQWETLVATIERAGGTVERIAGLPSTPDMVYAMNYGLVDGDRVAVTSFRHAERRPEADAAETWFHGRGLQTVRVGDERRAFEAGDAFLVGDAVLVSAGPRTDLTAHAELARALDVRVATVEVVHPALYHLDLSLCPLDENRAIIAPGAWSEAGRRVVAAYVREPLVLDDDEAFTFAANSVVVGTTVVMPATSPVRVVRVLEAWGFDVALVDVSELHKGGGSVRCMTLPLDTVLEPARVPGGCVVGAADLVPAQVARVADGAPLDVVPA